MPIEFRDLTWYLHGPNSTYVLFVDPSGYLQHGHWGSRLAAGDLAHWRPIRHRAFSPSPAGHPDTYSLDTVQAEFPAGGGDFRLPAIELVQADGTRALDLRYLSHRTTPGKPPLAGLPATYVEATTEADTLELVLIDQPSGLEVTLSYTVFRAHDALARSVRIHNTGTTSVQLLRVLSASVDLPEDSATHWLQLHGAWARERTPALCPIHPGMQSVESRRGASGHGHHPFISLLRGDTTETAGPAWGLSLVYSGNFLAGIERSPYGLTRVQLGINPAGFAWQLEPGASFQTPEAVLVFSERGLGALSRTYHTLYRTRLCRGQHRDRERPILINNWEATYFNFTEERLLALARCARDVGVELFVLDDGWFGHRDNDKSSLGDWTPHPAKFPDGMRRFGEKLAELGLQFGLWLEPEMVSPDSDLYRAHPDWCIHVPGRAPALGRHQLILDLSRPEVVEHVFSTLCAVLKSAPVRYVKWDMNRNMTDVASFGRAPANQGETAHRYILGLYQLLERVTQAFPHILFESCSGGGGRFDPGMLFYMPQTWTSDNSDAIARLAIQEGTSLIYPLSAMAAHISAVPNHQNHRTTPLATRALVAATGAFGLELDLTELPAEDLTALRRLIDRYKTWRPLLQHGELHRLQSAAAARGVSAWCVVAPDQSEALVIAVRTLAESNGPWRIIRPQGLDPAATYLDLLTQQTHPGDQLMVAGLFFPDGPDFHAQAWHLRRLASASATIT